MYLEKQKKDMDMDANKTTYTGKKFPVTIEKDIEYLWDQLRNFWIEEVLHEQITDSELENIENSIDKDLQYYIRKIDNHLEIGIAEIKYRR